MCVGGATGIAIIDNSGSRPFLRYVFDVADTGGGEETRPKLWKYREEYQDTVSAALEQRFDVSGSDLVEQFEKIAAQLAAEYWDNHQQDILRIVDGSFLEEYDAYNIGVQFKNAAAVSMRGNPSLQQTAAHPPVVRSTCASLCRSAPAR